MANSKHAHYRYNVLDYCFRKLALSKKDLLVHLNNRLEQTYDGERIELRQLDSDLNVFRRKKEGFNAPLPPKIRTYKYTNQDFSIAQRPLLEYEQYLIDATSRLLERFENHPKYDKLAETLIKFQDEQDSDFTIDYKKIIFGDSNEAYDGIKMVKPMFLAIKSKSVLSIATSKFDGSDKRGFIFHPHVLKQYNQRWFLFGFNATKNIPRYVIPLDDRFLSFEKIDDEIYQEDKINWKNYFEEMVGPSHYSITQEEPVLEMIILKFTKNRLPYFKSKPIHPIWDEFTEKGKENQVFFEAIVNRELVQQILSYGKDVEVIEPENLKNLIKEQAERILKYYSG
jgi:hypothetical protein